MSRELTNFYRLYKKINLVNWKISKTKSAEERHKKMEEGWRVKERGRGLAE